MEISLRTVGEGLMGTHVTWSDIEELVREKTKVDLKFGPKKTIRRVGEGQGFLSCIGVVFADWVGNVAGLPEEFAIKISTCVNGKALAEGINEMIGEKEENHEAGKRFEIVSRSLHNTEVNAYRLFEKYGNENMDVLKVYFSKEFTQENQLKGFIGMEYAKDISTLHVYNNVKVNDFIQKWIWVLRGVARLQACGNKFSEEEKTSFPNRFRMIYSSLTEPELLGRIFVGSTENHSESLKKKGQLLKEIAGDLADTSIVEELNAELVMKDVFINGDLWSANIMWKKEEDSLRLSKIIDYQICHFGCAAEDLTRVMISCLSGEDRRNNWEHLLEVFYGFLCEEFEGDEMPYTLEQLKESYRRMFPVAATVFVTIMSSVAKAGSKNQTASEKVAADAVLAEKLEAIYDDVLFYNNRNKSVRKAE